MTRIAALIVAAGKGARALGNFAGVTKAARDARTQTRRIHNHNPSADMLFVSTP